MNQIDRSRIWRMVIRTLSEKNGCAIAKEDADQKQFLDPGEVLKGFKKAIRKTEVR